MNRRYFLSALAASATAPRARSAAARIVRITLAGTEGRFHKFVAMNSYDKAPKGHTYPNTVVRIQTDQGVEGVGVTGYPAPDADFLAALTTLLGADPLELYRMDAGRITGRDARYAAVLTRYRHLDGPLFDLAGKLAGKPAWRLIGDAARDRVEGYDSTIYFSDIWFHDRGVRAVVEEAEEARRAGYRGIKLKLGRGSKWMEKAAGLKRDIEVVLAVRSAVGPDMRTMCDPNNGYRGDREGAWSLLSETASANLYWMEEIFPETVSDYNWLKDRLEKAGLKTRIADGESVDQPAEFAPYLKPRRLMDVLQSDIRRFGFLDSLAVARLAEPAGAVLIPHNWGAQTGTLMALHLAKAVKSVPFVEDDRSTVDVFAAEGYEFRDGMYTLPDKPGLSLRVDEAAYRLKCKASEVVVA